MKIFWLKFMIIILECFLNRSVVEGSWREYEIIVDFIFIIVVMIFFRKVFDMWLILVNCLLNE